MIRGRLKDNVEKSFKTTFWDIKIRWGKYFFKKRSGTIKAGAGKEKRRLRSSGKNCWISKRNILHGSKTGVSYLWCRTGRKNRKMDATITWQSLQNISGNRWENEKQKVFFNKILKEIKFDIVREWLYNRIKEKSTIYQRLQKEYKDHPAQLKVLLKHIEHGITKLPVFCSKKERLAVYAVQVTGDPHFFDSNTFAELLLFDFITYHFHTNNEESILESYEL